MTRQFKSSMIRGLHWFRNDLRLHDNRAVGTLADHAEAWLPVFVLDSQLITRAGRQSPRVLFMLDCLAKLEKEVASRGVELLVTQGEPAKVLPKLMAATGASVVSWTSASTPLARRRDAAVRRAIETCGGEALEVLDHTVFGPGEIQTKTGGPYSVYTPYRNEWWRAWHRQPRVSARRVQLPASAIAVDQALAKTRLKRIPLETTMRPGLPAGGERTAKRRLRTFLSGPAKRYHVDRDIPGIDGTSRLSPYLRFGAISVRRCVSDGLAMIEEQPATREGISKWLDELVWREFYHAVLVNSPHVMSGCYRPEYDQVHWTGTSKEFEAWCKGETGYPFVDAGMRQLATTGWMHNRVRMIVASFLTKDLRIDWRAGERFFMESLVDGDPASNNGGWQWSASTGTDAQPYFRIFNPVTQGKKFDPDGLYIRKWIPELRGLKSPVIHAPWEHGADPKGYPQPIVDHAKQRVQSIEEFKRVRGTAV